MTARSVLNFVNSKNFFFVAIVVFVLPFILFSFWNVPSADDYMILDKKQHYTFWGLQEWVYRTWSGRYLSTLISTSFSYSGFLYSHYYVHTILLLLFTVIGWCFLLKQVNRYFLENLVTPSSLVLAALFLLILEINIIPEPVTAFYWFSSAITYQVPLILMLFLAGTIIKMLNETNGSKSLNFIVAALLVVLLNGCNEAITLLVLIASTCITGYYYYDNKKLPANIVSLFILTIISSCFLLFAPGILYRGSLHEASPLLLIIAIAFIKFTVLNWFFLKEPLWWVFLLFVILFFLNNRKLSVRFLKRVTNRSITFLLLVYAFTGLLIYIPILYVANGSLPLRTENIICFLYSLILASIIAIFILAKTTTSVSHAGFYRYRYMLLSILIFSSANMKRVTDTLLSGFFYKQVMQERVSLFEDAKRKQLHEVTFDEYEIAVNKQLERHPLLDRRVLKNIIIKTPPLICFESDFYDINYMKELYGVKILHINKK